MINEKLKLDELNRIDIEQYQLNANASFIVILDNIRSAQNIGSIFRTADAFSVTKIILTGISAIPPNKEILKTALGSTESVKWIHFVNTIDAIELVKQEGYQIVSVEQTKNSTMLNQFMPQSNAKYALVLGNEVEGVNQDIINISNHILEIPQFGTKHSLNVAVSAGIVLWDFFNKLYLQKS